MAPRSEARKIDLNRASQEDLATIVGISLERASRLVQARNDYHGFSNWEEVATVEGVGPTLLSKLQSSTRLSPAASDGGEAARADADAAMDEPEATVFEELEEAADEVEDEIRALMALAQMDVEAATSYEIAAELVSDPDTQRTLREFAADHRRHVEDIRRIVAGMEIEAEFAASDPSTSVFVNMTHAMGSMGERAALLAMLGNEQFTNAAYDTALDLATDGEVRALLERNLADEQRHLSWLSQCTR